MNDKKKLVSVALRSGLAMFLISLGAGIGITGVSWLAAFAVATIGFCILPPGSLTGNQNAR